MNALEIVAIVVLCLFGACFVMLFGYVTLLFDEILRKGASGKKPTEKSEDDEEQDNGRV